MKKYSLVAAAVATVVSAGAFAAPPSLSQAANPTVSLVIAGSSAAQNAVVKALQVSVCGSASNALTITSTGNGNFQSVSCFTSAAITPFGGGTIAANTLVTVYYRSEGGSVVGALPLVTGYKPWRLFLADSSCTAAAGATVGSCAITGSSASNGTADSFTGAVTHDTVQLGVTDVEPGQLTGADFPSNYSPSVWGITAAGGQNAVQTKLAALPISPLVQQVFGIAVNTTGIPLNTAVNGAGVHLSTTSVANILSGLDSDWTQVPDAVTGAPIATGTSPVPITVINREPGSGTRTATNIFFFGYQCGTVLSIGAGAGSLNFSTGDDLTAASKANGSITYSSIDKVVPAGLTLATINGVTPSTLAAAAGEYGMWYEATFVPNASVSATSPTGILSQYLQNVVPLLANAPQQADINVIPGAGLSAAGNSNAPGLPLSNAAFTAGSGSTEIYISPYTRSGNSCNAPSATL